MALLSGSTNVLTESCKGLRLSYVKIRPQTGFIRKLKLNLTILLVGYLINSSIDLLKQQFDQCTIYSSKCLMIVNKASPYEATLK